VFSDCAFLLAHSFTSVVKNSDSDWLCSLTVLH